MRDATFPESGLKLKLLDAGERLFAENGFEAVSVRDITEMAKANVASVNYYFGSREALLGMVMARCMSPVTEARHARLDLLKKRWAGKAPPLEEIVEAMVLPLVEQVKKSGLSERLFYRLVGRIFAKQGDGLPLAIEEQLVKASDRFVRVFEKALPTVSAEELVWRTHFVEGGISHLLTHYDGVLTVKGGAPGDSAMVTTLKRFIPFACAGLSEGIEVTKIAEIEEIAEVVEPSPQAVFDF